MHWVNELDNKPYQDSEKLMGVMHQIPEIYKMYFLPYTLTKNVKSMRRIHARRVAEEGTCCMNQEGKIYTELVEMTSVDNKSRPLYKECFPGDAY